VRLGGLGILKKSNEIIGNQTRDLPACSIVPQPTTLPRAPDSNEEPIEQRSDTLPTERTCSVQSIAHALNVNAFVIPLH
jgi:hypothetical protein